MSEETSIQPGRYRHYKFAVITLIEEDYPVKFISLHIGPTTPLGQVHFVVAVPSPLDRWFAVSRGEAAVHAAVDVSEVELALTLRFILGSA